MNQSLLEKNKRVPLNLRELTTSLAQLPGWEHADGKLRREFVFADFTEAFGFMAAIATRAEAMNHHPEWSNVYNRVRVELVTHDTEPAGGGITPLDVHMAKIMSDLFDKLRPASTAN